MLHTDTSRSLNENKMHFRINCCVFCLITSFRPRRTSEFSMHVAKIIYSHYFLSEISGEMIVFYYIESIVFFQYGDKKLIMR